jgi:hypothetical protein
MNKKIVISFIIFGIITNHHLRGAAQADAMPAKPVFNFNVNTMINPGIAYASAEHIQAIAELSDKLKICGAAVRTTLQERLKNASYNDYIEEPPKLLCAEIKFLLDGENDLKTQIDVRPGELKLGVKKRAALIARLEKQIEPNVADIRQKFKKIYPQRAPDGSQLLVYVADYPVRR